MWPERAGWTAHRPADHRALRPGRRPAGRPGRPLLPARGTAPARCRRCCSRTASAARKNSVSDDAESLAGRGYAVLTWTAARLRRAAAARSTWTAPTTRSSDAQRLLDWLAARPEVRTDAAGDPRVGVVGGSYGGALALLLAGQDPPGRRDRPADHLERPDPGRSSRSRAGDDRHRRLQEGLGRPVLRQRRRGRRAAGPRRARAGDSPATDPACGRFAADVCAAYLSMATTGHAGRRRPSALLRRSSPAAVLDKIKAPTLLIQGEVDTLFPLSEADANARGIAADRHPGPGRLVHRRPRRRRRARRPTRTGPSSSPRSGSTTTSRATGDAPANSFTYSRVAGFSALDRGLVTNGYSDAGVPGPDRNRTHRDRRRPARRSRSPTRRTATRPRCPRCPGVGGRLSSLLGGVAGDLPGPARRLRRPRRSTDAIEVVGAPTVQLRAASPTGEATLFVKLYDVDPNGRRDAERAAWSRRSG